MLKAIQKVIVLFTSLIVVGCATTNSIPYKASTNNVISIQNTFKSINSKVSLGEFVVGNGVDQELNCRLLGPVKVAPGKPLSSYIKEAFQEELFMAQAYDSAANVKIDGVIEKIAFSSVSPANWEIVMRVRSNKSEGYTVAVKYDFDSSFDAFSACRNVADAFAPSVQELLKKVITHPQFAQLAK